MMDEFDMGLHTRLADFILDLIHASEGSQLLFSSHNTNLIDVKRLRRDQIVFVNKSDDGETEVGYINLLKTWYKSPIRIVSHIEVTKITPSLVEKRTKELKISRWDKVHTFLMYDMDVQAINEMLLKCKAEMLLSNPYFEALTVMRSEGM